MELAYALAEHAGTYPDVTALAQVVRQFSVRKHHDRSTVVLCISISETLAGLWRSIKDCLLARGAQQHIGQPPRGPIFRELIGELQAL